MEMLPVFHVMQLWLFFFCIIGGGVKNFTVYTSVALSGDKPINSDKSK
jgi:hypothetical protein